MASSAHGEGGAKEFPVQNRVQRLAALLPGLILATFLIQLVQTCLGIVGWALLCQSTPKNRPTDIPEASLMEAIPPLTFSLPGCV